MSLREYYNQNIEDFFQRKKIEYKIYHSKKSDYYYILNIKGRNKHTLKIRVSDHLPKNKYELPFLLFWHNKKEFPKRQLICSDIGSYIAKYRDKI